MGKQQETGVNLPSTTRPAQVVCGLVLGTAYATGHDGCGPIRRAAHGVMLGWRGTTTAKMERAAVRMRRSTTMMAMAEGEMAADLQLCQHYDAAEVSVVNLLVAPAETTQGGQNVRPFLCPATVRCMQA